MFIYTYKIYSQKFNFKRHKKKIFNIILMMKFIRVIDMKNRLKMYAYNPNDDVANFNDFVLPPFDYIKS